MVELVRMSEAEFAAYLERAVRGYAEEKVRAGNWTEAIALERSRAEYDQLLPQGLATPGQHIFSIVNSETDERVGMIWLGEVSGARHGLMYIYDFEIFEAHRRKGYGERTLEVVELFVQAQGARELALHVFGHNAAARALYQKAGYEETNVHMRKRLE